MIAITIVVGSMCVVLVCYGVYVLITHLQENKIFPKFLKST